MTTTRITNKDLEAVCKRINEATNSPIESYTRFNGQCKANIGNYHIDGAYGGVALHRMENDGGGISDVLRVGHVSKRELYNLMQSFLRGLEAK